MKVSRSVECDLGNLKIIVPFYKNSHLVKPLFESLLAIKAEIQSAKAELLFFNDSPDDPDLASALETCAKDSDGLYVEIITNPVNLGFVKTVNQGFRRASANRSDVIILNSDTYVFPGAVKEMMAVAELDPMIGFVCPRSNNATLATYPHSSLDLDIGPQVAYERYLRTAKTLPRFTWAPTAVGFCMLIRWQILRDIGDFDELYGQGYSEENDLICRAARYGYRAVLANHAFVWHQGEASFSTTNAQKSERESRNLRLLANRYPEYLIRVHHYFHSPEHRAESLWEQLNPVDSKVKIGFDFSSFGTYHNGTFEAGVKLLRAAAQHWPKTYQLCVFISKPAFYFHQLEKIPGIKRIDFSDAGSKMAATVRMGQPFSGESLVNLYNSASVVSVFMLDAIAFDCGHLSIEFDRRIWDYVCSYSDAIFSISQFTADRLESRFNIKRHVTSKVCRLSLDVSEYQTPKIANEDDPPEDYFFVVGNKFPHKFVKETVSAIAKDNPEITLKVVGTEIPSGEKVKVVAPGQLTDDEFSKLYSRAKAVIFPSLYEGFGFPILHSLAHKKIVYARDSELNRELIEEIGDDKNIRLFCDTQHLLTLLRQDNLAFKDPCQLREIDGWKRGALEVLETLEIRIASVEFKNVAERLRWLDYMVAQKPSALTHGQHVGAIVASKIDAALHRKMVRIPARWVWRNVVKPLMLR